MLERHQPVAIYMEGHAVGQPGKMGHGVIRYSPNPIVCVIDSAHAGSDMAAVANMPHAVPIVHDVATARKLGAEVLILGIAPRGGLIPDAWLGAIDEAVQLGMSVLNGLHSFLGPRYPQLSDRQWVWDVRREPEGLGTANGLAAKLSNRRVLMVGTDMSVGKMTAGLEIYRLAREWSVSTEFVATGQIGITVTGRGIPLDAIRLDFAAGAVEKAVLDASKTAELVIVEGQGSLAHPASSANLPLLRGSMPTHLILCHRAGQEHVYGNEEVKIPALDQLVRLFEDVASACGTFPRPKTVGVALNTFHIDQEDVAMGACLEVEALLGVPCVDPVRHGPERLLGAILA